MVGKVCKMEFVQGTESAMPMLHVNAYKAGQVQTVRIPSVSPNACMVASALPLEPASAQHHGRASAVGLQFVIARALLMALARLTANVMLSSSSLDSTSLIQSVLVTMVGETALVELQYADLVRVLVQAVQVTASVLASNCACVNQDGEVMHAIRQGVLARLQLRAHAPGMASVILRRSVDAIQDGLGWIALSLYVSLLARIQQCVRHLVAAAALRVGPVMTAASQFVTARRLVRELATRTACAMIQIDANAQACGVELLAILLGAME